MTRIAIRDGLFRQARRKAALEELTSRVGRPPSSSWARALRTSDMRDFSALKVRDRC